jgi:hypothetical protein
MVTREYRKWQFYRDQDRLWRWRVLVNGEADQEVLSGGWQSLYEAKQDARNQGFTDDHVYEVMPS